MDTIQFFDEFSLEPFDSMTGLSAQKEPCPDLASSLFTEFDLVKAYEESRSFPTSSTPTILSKNRMFLFPPSEEVSMPTAALHCPYCHRLFSKKRYLKDHLRVHSTERPFTCVDCEKSFKFKSHLNDHVRSHRDERKFICPDCNKGFCRSSTLTRHLRCHSKEKPYVCEFCLRGFTQSGNLNIHLKKHCKSKPKKEE